MVENNLKGMVRIVIKYIKLYKIFFSWYCYCMGDVLYDMGGVFYYYN